MAKFKVGDKVRIIGRSKKSIEPNKSAYIEDLLKWIFIPELQLVEYISSLVNNVQM